MPLHLNNPPDLKPCPFCGGEAVLTERHGEGYSVYGRFWYSVECTECETAMHDREEWDEQMRLKLPPLECVERWNGRPS